MREQYWEDKNIKGSWREQWARIRFGNLSKEGSKGFKNEKCRIFFTEKESFRHIWDCREAIKSTKASMVKELDEWKEKNGGPNRNWDNTIREAIKGNPVKEICVYAIQWGK